MPVKKSWAVLALVCGLVAACLSSGHADEAQVNPGGGLVRAPQNKVSIAATSKIDVNSVGPDYVVTIDVDYENNGPANETLMVEVFDENAAESRPTFRADGVEAGYRILPNTKGQKTFTYKIKKNSEWGEDIADGTFDQIWAVAGLSESYTIRLMVTDSMWVYSNRP